MAYNIHWWHNVSCTSRYKITAKKCFLKIETDTGMNLQKPSASLTIATFESVLVIYEILFTFITSTSGGTFFFNLLLLPILLSYLQSTRANKGINIITRSMRAL